MASFQRWGNIAGKGEMAHSNPRGKTGSAEMERKCLGLRNLLPQLFASTWPSSRQSYTVCIHRWLRGGACPVKEMVLLMVGENVFSLELS